MNNIMKSRAESVSAHSPRCLSHIRRRKKFAFTLIELLVVIAVIALLATLMFPSLGNVFGVARSTECGSRLREIGKAVKLAEANEKRDAIQAMAWQSVLTKYLGGDRTCMVCPEYAQILSDRGEKAPEDAPEPLPLEDLAAFRVNEQYYDDLGEGPFVAKLSDDNWNRARAAGWLVESANNFKRENWQDGSEKNANPYWLCLEDHGGDWDQKDVMVKVTISETGYLLELMSGSTGHRNYIVSKPDHEVLTDQIKSRTAFGSMKAITIGGGGGITSYGMNAAIPDSLDTPGNILVLDYYWLIASPTDIWSDYPSPDNIAVPVFARHKERVNVLFVDGSVKSTDPFDINPRHSTYVEQAYWLP